MLVPGAWWPVSRQTIRLRPERRHLDVAGAPVRDVGVVERRLEELVLEHQPLVVADAARRSPRATSARRSCRAADVVLARVVGAVGQPDLEVARAGLGHDLDAAQVVVDRLLADRRVDVGEAAELVVVVLEGVRVDGAERDAVVLGVRAERRVVVDLIPRDVQGHRRREAGDLLTFAASAIFSSGVRGVPGVPKTLKRVPELPNAQEGSSMAWVASAAETSLKDVIVPHSFELLESFQTVEQKRGDGSLAGRVLEAHSEALHTGSHHRYSGGGTRVNHASSLSSTKRDSAASPPIAPPARASRCASRVSPAAAEGARTTSSTAATKPVRESGDLLERLDQMLRARGSARAAGRGRLAPRMSRGAPPHARSAADHRGRAPGSGSTRRAAGPGRGATWRAPATRRLRAHGGPADGALRVESVREQDFRRPRGCPAPGRRRARQPRRGSLGVASFTSK